MNTTTTTSSTAEGSDNSSPAVKVSDGTWTSWGSFTSDHSRFLVMLPEYLSSYALLSPFRLCHKPAQDGEKTAAAKIYANVPCAIYAKAFFWRVDAEQKSKPKILRNSSTRSDPLGLSP
mmetsp:Transcript_6524/g.15527  ORF Transcript_6524/g.15527 Transcript_6524/m.15527 type:complete len:119 (+) Transcript_6524:189-545(+)|eukprot:CAMPEP_0201136070 /NCGR_PEP_ID=MMETSP0850-20130426/54664_1 /ASSEMBLY_ACC=CAM_ASM_000622 /TAXON_ID=183588 /ORGANISM="Pseudo-nitzschia fraudulenta, Strain WWA7" /LENGTH=118 /DNA_ID=CAMNT_0047407335 /DNA_START=175 /DNA_END=531 /DNA_ORIENTATION=-